MLDSLRGHEFQIPTSSFIIPARHRVAGIARLGGAAAPRLDRPRYLKGLQPEIAAELARCLDSFVHEQDIRPYGAIVAREMPHLERLGRIVDTQGLQADVIASLADGRHSLVLVVKGHPPQLLLLHERMDTDQDYASHAVWVDGLIICNDAAGTVRIVTNSSVTVVEGRRWFMKDLVYEAAEDIIQVVPAAILRWCAACWSSRITASARIDSEKIAIDGDDLGHIGDRVLRQAGSLSRQQDIAGGFDESQVRRQHDDGGRSITGAPRLIASG
jgi:hypothetical protein